MLRSSLALLAIAAIATSTPTAPADAQTRKNDNYYYYGDNNYRTYGHQQYNSGAVRGRYDPNSYDGRRTGQPRTCGHDFLLRDGRGSTTGPYCN
jgi:hypothetical protein